MSEKPSPLPGDFSDSILGKATSGLAWLLITTVMLFLCSIPSIFLFGFLHPEEPALISNALVVILALALLGPAISAGLYSARAQANDEDKAPFKAYWRGYRMNFFDVMRVWFPACVVIGLITFFVGIANVSGVSLVNIGLIGIAVAVLIWALHSLTIATFISMPPGGVARLGLLYVGRIKKVTLGLIAIMIVVALVAAGLPGGIFFVAVLSGFLIWMLYQNAIPMISDATEHYTVNGAAPHDVIGSGTNANTGSKAE